MYHKAGCMLQYHFIYQTRFYKAYVKNNSSIACLNKKKNISVLAFTATKKGLKSNM